MGLCGSSGSCGDKDVEEHIRWLQSGKVFGHDKAVQRLYCERLRRPDSACALAYVEHFRKCQERLKRLYEISRIGHEKHEEFLPADLHTFNSDEFPGYNTSLVHIDDVRVYRVQPSGGLCYMHAPALLQYYKVWHDCLNVAFDDEKNEKNNVPHLMLDLGRVLLNFTPEQLKRHVFEDQGGDSVQFLRSLFKPNVNVKIFSAEKSNFELYLREHGPGLVAGFHVYEDFRNHATHKHYGKPQGNFTGSWHAMVMVGVRSHEDKVYYLLQNFWSDKQFVEVDADYFDACEANVYFVKGHVDPRDLAGLPTNTGKYFEFDGDKEEGIAGED